MIFGVSTAEESDRAHTLSHLTIPLPMTPHMRSSWWAIFINTGRPSVPGGAYVQPLTIDFSMISLSLSARLAPCVVLEMRLSASGRTCGKGGLACSDSVCIVESSSKRSNPMRFMISAGNRSTHVCSTLHPRPLQAGSKSSISVRVGGRINPIFGSSISSGS